MNGLLPMGAGLLLLSAGAVALVRSSGTHAAERRLLESRLDGLRCPDDSGGFAFATSRFVQNAPLNLRTMLARADLELQPDHIALLAGGMGLSALMVLWALGWIAALLLVIFEIAGVFFTVRAIAHRRVAAFIDDLPFFLDTVRQMLTTGNSVQQALTRATENAEPALQRYLLPMARRMQNGASVGDSAVWLADYLDIIELHMFATAVQTNIRYGGRLSLILANLVEVLRSRARVIRELRSATAEIRMSGIILGCLPLAAGGFILFSNPSYMKFFFVTTQGNHLILTAAVLQGLGILAMRWLMTIDY